MLCSWGVPIVVHRQQLAEYVSQVMALVPSECKHQFLLDMTRVFLRDAAAAHEPEAALIFLMIADCMLADFALMQPAAPAASA